LRCRCSFSGIMNKIKGRISITISEEGEA